MKVFLFILLVFFSFFSKSQDSTLKIVVLSYKLDEVIDLDEKIRYNLFPYLSNDEFKYASFFIINSEFVLLKYTLKNEAMGDTVISTEYFNILRSRLEKPKKENNSFNTMLGAGKKNNDLSFEDLLKQYKSKKSRILRENPRYFGLFGINGGGLGSGGTLSSNFNLYLSKYLNFEVGIALFHTLAGSNIFFQYFSIKNGIHTYHTT